MIIIDLDMYRQRMKLRKNNEILKRALAVFDYDKDKFHEILKEYDMS